jgi:penicillin-binding protein 2
MLIFDQLKKNDPQLRTITWCVLAGMGLLLAGLWYVQVISHRDYAENQKAQSFRTVRIPAIRGRILDRHERALAENQPSYNVCLYLDELRKQFKEEWARSRPKNKLTRARRAALEAQTRYRVVSNATQKVAATLQQPVTLERDKFLKHYTNQLALPLPLLIGLNPAQVARFQEQPANVPGVDLEIQPVRLYPQGTTAAHVLGYLIRDDSSAQDEDAFFNFRLPDYRGKIGIEGAFDQELRGKAGVKSVLVNSLGYRQVENIWTPAEPGRNIVLTLDLHIQQAAERALQSPSAETRGAVVVLDPRSGDILALASSPAFDPNQFVPQITEQDYARLNDLHLRPQINRAAQENYQPGSIFKIVTAMACLEAGLDPNETIYNPGYIYVGRRPINDLAAPGEYNFRRAFVKSSNTFFITNGLKAGVEKIVEIGNRLHLGERMGLPTGQEVSGYFPKLKNVRIGWVPGDTANLCIGQGRIDVTPLQMAVMTAAIANGGQVLWPRLVDRIEPADPHSGEPVVAYPAGRVRDELGVRPRTLELIREAMLADVEDAEGTGKGAAVPGLRIGGKTGTAQVTDFRNRLVDHITWFVSFAPFEAPRYVVVVMVESGASGGGTCAPIAQKVYRALQQYDSDLRTPAVARKG